MDAKEFQDLEEKMTCVACYLMSRKGQINRFISGEESFHDVLNEHEGQITFMQLQHAFLMARSYPDVFTNLASQGASYYKADNTPDV